MRLMLDKGLAPGTEWDERELVTLGLAEETANRLELLRTKLAEELALPGSSERAVDLAAEVRQHEHRLQQMVEKLNPEPAPAKSWQHQKAAHARWNRAPGA